MKIKRKEKTVYTSDLKLSKAEMFDLYSELYDMSVAEYPRVFDLLDALRAQVHRL